MKRIKITISHVLYTRKRNVKSLECLLSCLTGKYYDKNYRLCIHEGHFTVSDDFASPRTFTTLKEAVQHLLLEHDFVKYGKSNNILSYDWGASKNGTVRFEEEILFEGHIYRRVR